MKKYFSILTPLIAIGTANAATKSFVTAKNEFYVGTSVNLEKNKYSLKSDDAIVTIDNSAIVALQESQEAEIVLKQDLISKKEYAVFASEYKREKAIIMAAETMEEIVSSPEYTGNPADHELYEIYLHQMKFVETHASNAAKLQAELDLANNDLVALLEEFEGTKAEIASLLSQNEALNTLSKIKNSATATNVTGSIALGYMHNLNQYVALGLEAGVDLGKVKIGKNTEQELQVKSNIGMFVAMKAGYRFEKNSLAYLNLGLASRKYDARYEALNASISSSGYVNQFLIGIGAETRVSKSVAIFGELNNLSAINSINVETMNRDLKVSSNQVKIGARYYF